MFIFILLLIPLMGLLFTASKASYNDKLVSIAQSEIDSRNVYLKTVALQTSICTLLVSILIFALFDFSSNQFQFVQEHHEIHTFDLYLGMDGLSVYFVLLTTIIIPISLLSN